MQTCLTHVDRDDLCRVEGWQTEGGEETHECCPKYDSKCKHVAAAKGPMPKKPWSCALDRNSHRIVCPLERWKNEKQNGISKWYNFLIHTEKLEIVRQFLPTSSITPLTVFMIKLSNGTGNPNLEQWKTLTFLQAQALPTSSCHCGQLCGWRRRGKNKVKNLLPKSKAWRNVVWGSGKYNLKPTVMWNLEVL